MTFSQRYSNFIGIENGKFVDKICGEVSSDVKVKIGEILNEFSQPILIHTDRYSGHQESTNAYLYAIELLHKQVGREVISFSRNIFDSTTYQNSFMNIFTPWLLDLIELQFCELSDNEKHDFQVEVNNVFENHDIPWLLVDGRMIKIDAQQFELDLRTKALDALNELKNTDPKFQSAYDELMQACDFLESEHYSEAIVNAENSYESVLKVICELKKGSADNLTTVYTENILNNLPSPMTNKGFREKVMMTLPFIRNNSSSGHGAGSEVAVISKPLAKLAVNLSAAMNTYLIEEYANKKADAKTEILEEESDELPF